MNLRKTLAAFGLVGFMASCSPSTVPIHFKPKLDPISYDNSADRIIEKDLKAILPNIREINTYGLYALTGCCDKIRVDSNGGSTVMVKRDEHYDYYLTAEHVVGMAPEKEFFFTTMVGSEVCHGSLLGSTISFSDTGRTLDVLVQDEMLDFAYLRSPRDDSIAFGSVELGDSSLLSEGDFVYAIGYTLGIDRFVTAGNVSALRFALGLNATDNFMFTAPITFGNSGGGVFALYNGKPYLVGLTSFMLPSADNMYGAVKINKILEAIRLALGNS